jgi:ribosomal protein L15
LLGPISGEVGDGQGRGIAGRGHAGAPARRGCYSMQAYSGLAIPVLGHARLLRRQLTMEAGSR